MDNVKQQLLPASILVVDDHHENLQWLSQILSDAGYTIRPTTDWEAAIISAQANPPDLILLDVVLPGTNGYEICRLLKDDERTREVPVIFISALSEPVDKVRAFGVGGVDYISKPLHGDEVLARVATHHLLRRMQRRLQEQNDQLQREIAERQAAEMALRASEERFRAVWERASDAMVLVDAAGLVVAANPAFCQLFQMRPEQIEGHDCAIVLPRERRAAARDVYHRLFTATSSLEPLETQVHGADGEAHQIEARVDFIEQQGRRVAALAIIRDVTERRRMEAALQASRATLRAIIDHAPVEITARDLEGRFTMANRKFADLVGLDEPEQALGKRIEDYFSPEQCETIRDMDRQALASGQPVVRELPMVYADQLRTRLVMRFPISDAAGKTAALGTFVQDISERRRTELELEQTNIALHKHVNELSTLGKIVGLLSDLAELPEALRQVCALTSQLLGFHGALIGTFTPDHQSLAIRAQFTEDGSIPNLVGRSIALVKPVSGPIDRRRALQERILGAIDAPLSALVGTNLHLLPMRSHGRLVGALVALPEASSRELSLSDIALAETIAGHIAVAVENARLHEQAQINAADAERQRLSRDLHDSVVQLLYSLKLLTEAWATRSAAGTLDDVAGRMGQLGSISQQALREMRLLIHQLRPAVLEEVGLIGALQRRLELVEQRLGIAARVDVEGDFTGLPHALEEQLFAITQEALNNALRHSEAGEMRVSARLVDGEVIVTVADDGHGFELTTQTGGLGLTTMRERAEAIGGTVTIASTLWQGTRVSVRAPVQASVEQEQYPMRVAPTYGTGEASAIAGAAR
ncbi:MAG: PAS domain S-box protein [Chloroflexales bacterium]|nr:PAS domain S-box protein [Chloroflexales bacterium]